MKFLSIYTDGSCNNNSIDKFGGYSCIIQICQGFKPLKSMIVYGGEYKSTSARMELMAVKSALQFGAEFNEEVHITINTDAEYIVNSINKGWLWSWYEMGFTNTKNSEIWKKILKQLNNPNILSLTINHVKGHSGIENNEKADVMAGFASEMMRRRYFDDTRQWKRYKAVQQSNGDTWYHPNIL